MPGFFFVKNQSIGRPFRPVNVGIIRRRMNMLKFYNRVFTFFFGKVVVGTSIVRMYLVIEQQDEAKEFEHKGPMLILPDKQCIF